MIQENLDLHDQEHLGPRYKLETLTRVPGPRIGPQPGQLVLLTPDERLRE
jgi:hypothetical protein